MVKELHNWLEKSRTLWITVFALLLVLSMDFWNWEVSKIYFDFLPVWIIRLIILQMLLAVAIYIFSKTYWGEER